MKVYARVRNLNNENKDRLPYNKNIALSVDGFREMGFEVIFYEINELPKIKEIYERGDIVLDGIDQVNFILDKFGIVPPSFEYPDSLKKYLGRKIWMDKIDNINSNPEKWGVFVKPVKEKRFTGKVINSTKDLIGCGSGYENFDVYCSEVVDFVFEVRGLVYYDQLVALQPYRGDWKYMNKLDTELINRAFKDFIKSDDKLNGCTLDFGVTKDGRTLFIEANYGMCFGPYMTNSITYAKIISACLSQISGTKDECYFGRIPCGNI